MWLMACLSHSLSVTNMVPNLGRGNVNLQPGYPEQPMNLEPRLPLRMIKSEPHFSHFPTILSVRSPSRRDVPISSSFLESSANTDVSSSLDSSITSSSLILRSEIEVISFSRVWVISG